MATKWQELYQILRKRIIDGVYPPGSDFPTNIELVQEFNLHTATIQQAVNALIREGLVFSSTKRAVRRKVRPALHRSRRKGGFTNDLTGKKAKKELVELKIITDEKDIPQEVLQEMKPPVLFYYHNQWLDDTLIAVSRSYIPNLIPLDKLENMLKQEGARLYLSMKALGFNPTMCEEALIAGPSTEEENLDLQLPANSSITVARITHKVFDDDGNLLEYCFLIDRADCHVFEYRFPLF